ncbi:MAG: hypothetical protein ACREOY_10130 [Candidatus Dormibacteraceae bacterium]
MNPNVPNRRRSFDVKVDAGARAWMDSHPAAGTRVISYAVKRCCGGGRICMVQVREASGRDDVSSHTPAALDGGTELLVDPRAAARLPARFGLTVRGLGPFKHLDLVLDGEQWGNLLYD